MNDAFPQFDLENDRQAVLKEAALTEAVRHVDIVHISLAGMTGIVILLLAALALPVFGHQPVTQPIAFWIMTTASFIGIVGLYILNYRVHRHVTEQAGLTEVLVNSLGQGFAAFGSDGVCDPVYSQACFDLLEKIPANKHISTVLGLSNNEVNDFNEWLEILFQKDHALGFDDVVCFFPKYYAHSKGRRVSLVYRPIEGKEGALDRVVVIATDQTEEHAARVTAKKQQDFAEMICRIFRDRNQFQSTVVHVQNFLDQAQSDTVSIKDATDLLRQLHTMKAAVKQFNLVDFSEVIHSVENDLRAPGVQTNDLFLKKLKHGCDQISATLSHVKDEVFNLMGGVTEWRGSVREIPEEDLYHFAHQMQETNTAPHLIEAFLHNIVAIPVQDCFRSFERELIELAAILDKQVKPIHFEGTNPRVLSQPMQEFLFSLTHICRNIIDHGIEPPVTRMARGKDAAGQVTILSEIVDAPHGHGQSLRIVISDDGNGIDPSKIRAKLSSIDPDGSWRTEDDHAVIQRIFSWGFTTRDTVTNLSGRGVGTEVIDLEVKKLGGKISVSSQLYKGSSFEIVIPYALKLPQ